MFCLLIFSFVLAAFLFASRKTHRPTVSVSAVNLLRQKARNTLSWKHCVFAQMYQFSLNLSSLQQKFILRSNYFMGDSFQDNIPEFRILRPTSQNPELGRL